MLRNKLMTISVLASALVLVLLGAVNAAVEKGPYLIYDGVNTEMTVLWQLDSSQSCNINWGENTSYSMGTAVTGEKESGIYGHQHTYTITGLTPGTKYFYQVICIPDNVGNGSFYTAPLDDADSVKFMVYGDTRTYPVDHDGVNARMITTYTDDPGYQTLTLHLGDWVENGDNEDNWSFQFFDPAYLNTHEFQANMPINGCKGNHEGSGNLFKKYFPYPYEHSGFYWSFDYGPAHIVIIDQYVDYSPHSEQYNWLVNDLASTNKEWKFLVFHEPAWSAGGHSNNTEAQDYIQPLCLTYGVDIVFAGHNHYYARGVVGGVQHITTGGGGAPLYSPNPSNENILKVAESYHFCEVDIQSNQLDFTAIDVDGNIIDSFSISHPPNDGCPNDPNKTEPGICGCGTPDTDTDSDGTPDCSDYCPNDPNKIEPGVCGCGVTDTDSDGDGMTDCWEKHIIDAHENDNITGIDNVLPGDDFDSDGWSNLMEYMRGTDPTNPNSHPSKAMPFIPLLLLLDN